MTQKDKELLLRDLCARVPYGVKCKLIYNNQAIKDEDATLFGIDKYGSFLFAEFGEDTRKFVCKPYLFPMSNMTEEQFNEKWELEHSDDMEHLSIPALDWLNKNHFDYRGLIEKGLAIDATNLNIY
jgi:hypothetical protein